MRFVAIFMAAALAASPAVADVKDRPPDGSKLLSEIIASVEKRENFAFIDEVDLEDGIYEIVYFMKDGAEVKLKLDPRTGQPPVQSQPAR